MKTQFAFAGVLVATLTGVAVLAAQDARPAASPAAAAADSAESKVQPEQKPQDLPGPGPAAATAEHAWLQQSVGEWDTEAELLLGPGQPPVKSKGTETVRAVGKLWTMGELKCSVMDMSMTGVLTLGFDPAKKKYVGTWVDSVNAHLWHYEGAVDAAGKVLTLHTEGPNPAAPGTTAKFKETIEFKDKDHKVFSSSMEIEPGKWVTFMTANYTRKK